MNNKILIPLSGGIDSLYVLYLALTNTEYNEYDIETHHIHFINPENRDKAEKLAISKILEYFRINYRYKRFTHKESTIQVPWNNNNKSGMYDSDAVNFVCGYLCSVDRTIVEIQFGTNATDLIGDGRNNYINTRATVGNTILRAFTEVRKTYPIRHLSKKDIVEALPKELLELTWSCRTPTYVNEKPIACNNCKTCKQLEELKVVQNLP